MTLKCKNDNGAYQDVEWQYIKKGWVPAISICTQRLYSQTEQPPSGIPKATGFSVMSNSVSLKYHWNPSDTYYGFAEVKVNDGNWVFWVPEEWGGIDPDSDHWQISLEYYGATIGDTLYFRFRFGDEQFASKYSDYVETSLVVEPYAIFQGNSTPNLEDFINCIDYNGDEANLTLEGNNIIVDDPELVYGFDGSSNDFNGKLNLTGCFNISYAWCPENNFTEIDASYCYALEYLGCYGNELLETVNLEHCESLTSTDGNNCANLVSLNLNYTNIGYCEYEDCESLETVYAQGIDGDDDKAYVSFYNDNLSADAINNIFESLGELDGELSKNLIDIGENPGSLSCDPSAALAKGWYVSGGPTLLFQSDDSINPIYFSSDYIDYTDVDFVFSGSYVYASNIEGINEINWFNGLDNNQEAIGNNLTGMLWLIDTNLTSLNIKNCSGITDLYISYSDDLVELDITGCSSLENLETTNNSNLTEITGLRLDCLALTSFNCTSNNFVTVDISDITSLEELRCSYNGNCESINVSGCSSLTHLEAGSVPITSLDLSDCVLLDYLYIPGCGLESLDLSNNTALTELMGYNNTSLTSITIDGIATLESLNLENSGLTNLDVNDCTGLTYFTASNSASLASVNADDCSALRDLIVSNSAITSLSAANTAVLYVVQIQLNNLDASALNAFFTQLPDRTGDDAGLIWYGSNPGSGAADASILSGKNWTSY